MAGETSTILFQDVSAQSQQLAPDAAGTDVSKRSWQATDVIRLTVGKHTGKPKSRDSGGPVLSIGLTCISGEREVTRRAGGSFACPTADPGDYGRPDCNLVSRHAAAGAWLSFKTTPKMSILTPQAVHGSLSVNITPRVCSNFCEQGVEAPKRFISQMSPS